MERVEPFQRSHGSSWDNDNRSDYDDNQPCEDSIPDTPKPGPASSKLRLQSIIDVQLHSWLQNDSRRSVTDVQLQARPSSMSEAEDSPE